jgi:hypothetical protein
MLATAAAMLELHMRFNLSIALVAMALFLAGCSGGNPFAPPAGPYSATFYVEGAEVGQFTLTTGDGQLAGTGMLTHAGSDVIVSIAAVIDGRQITGHVSNSLEGSGPFNGNFGSSDNCSGTFSFTDNLGIATSNGTWAAYLD